jgi:formylglycine-generating enzyme required for sulfatase activity
MNRARRTMIVAAIAALVVFGLACSPSRETEANLANRETDDDVNPPPFGDDDTLADPGFALISGGTFKMGSPPDEPGRNLDETQHSATLTNVFEIGVYETTQNDFQTLMGWNPSHFTACGDDCPVETVSWYDALAYADQLSSKMNFTPCFIMTSVVCVDGENVGPSFLTCESGTHGGIQTADLSLNEANSVYDCEGYRLPTEAEREYATRAGATTALYDGSLVNAQCAPLDQNLDAIGWYCGNDAATTNPVGQKIPNAWGLYDMSGNVWDWVWDWAADYEAEPATDPEGPLEGSRRVIRGGGWSNLASDCRSASRNGVAPGVRLGILGFRVARTL